MTASMKKITWFVIYLYESKLHILQLHVVQKYMHSLLIKVCSK